MKFFADEMFGKLARFLRAAGYDTCYQRQIDDSELAQRAESEDRIVLTRHRAFSVKTGYGAVFVVESTNTFEQLVLVTRRFSLDLLAHSFERCIECNSMLVPADKEENIRRIPPLVRNMTDEYFECRKCDKLYWQGTHCESIGARLEEAQRIAGETC